jgi:hypothetical protein
MRATSSTGSTHLFCSGIDPMLMAWAQSRHSVPQDNHLQTAQRQVGQQFDQLFEDLSTRRDEIDMA